MRQALAAFVLHGDAGRVLRRKRRRDWPGALQKDEVAPAGLRLEVFHYAVFNRKSRYQHL